nr:MAG TPA: hypothetical protein [Caudoviricetes sp.]
MLPFLFIRKTLLVLSDCRVILNKTFNLNN